MVSEVCHGWNNSTKWQAMMGLRWSLTRGGGSVAWEVGVRLGCLIGQAAVAGEQRSRSKPTLRAGDAPRRVG